MCSDWRYNRGKRLNDKSKQNNKRNEPLSDPTEGGKKLQSESRSHFGMARHSINCISSPDRARFIIRMERASAKSFIASY